MSTWNFEMDFGAGYVDIASCVIPKTVSKKPVIHKDMKSTTSAAHFSIYGDATIIASLMVGDADIPCKITKDSARWFTGFYQRTTTVSEGSVVADVPLTIYDPSIKLKRKLTANYKKWGSTVSVIVGELLTAGGITDQAIDTISKSIDAVYFKSGDITYFDAIDKILNDFGYVLYFDASGNAKTYLLFPAAATSTATYSTGAAGEIFGKLKLTRKALRYGGVSVTYYKHETLTDKIIFSDSTGVSVLNKCNIDLTKYSNVYPPRTSTEEVYCEYEIENEKIVGTNTVTPDITYTGSVSVDTFTDYGLKAAVKITGTGIITRLDIKAASVIVRGDAVIKQSIITGLNDDLEEYKAQYVSADADAEILVSGRRDFWEKSGITYSCKIDEIPVLGAIVTLVSTALSISVKSRIIAIEETDFDDGETVLYTIFAEAIEAYALRTLTTIRERGPNAVQNVALLTVLEGDASTLVLTAAKKSALVSLWSKIYSDAVAPGGLTSVIPAYTGEYPSLVTGATAVGIWTPTTAGTASYEYETKTEASAGNFGTGLNGMLSPANIESVTEFADQAAKQAYADLWAEQAEAADDLRDALTYARTPRELTSLTADVGTFTGQIAHYLGRTYRWSGSAWVSIDVAEPNTWSHHDLIGLPDYPDDPAGTTYRNIEGWTSGVDGWLPNHSIVQIVDSELEVTPSPSDFSAYTYKNNLSPNGKYLIVKVRCSIEIITFYYYNGSLYVPLGPVVKGLDGYYYCAGLVNTSSTTLYFRAYKSLASVDPVYIADIYVGTGATISRIIDNSGNGHHITPVALIPVVDATAPGGRYVKLSGQPSYASGTLSGFTSALFLAFPFYLPAASTTEKIVAESSTDYTANDGAWALVWNWGGTAGRLALVMRTASGEYLGGYCTPTALTWYFSAIQYNQGDAAATALGLYLNGVLQTLTSLYAGATRPAVYNGAWYLGARAGTSLFSDLRIGSPIVMLNYIPDQEDKNWIAAGRAMTSRFSLADWRNDRYSDDDIIQSVEKQRVAELWADYSTEYDTILVAATAAGVSATALTAARNALYAYLYTTPAVLNPLFLTSDTTIDGATYDALWTTMRVQLLAVMNAISDKYAADAEAAAAADATYKANAAQAAAQGYADGLASDLQSQIDGNISSWFYSGVPTLSNAPASSWTTDALKNNHLGDLYYDTATGYAYRFAYITSVYQWQKITDSDVTEALALAAAAQETADAKRRCFTSTPTTPYNVGDIWVEGSSGDIKYCDTERLTGAYDSNDWSLASKYTDDTTASAAQADATSALGTISDISSDNKLTPVEKSDTRLEWDTIAAELSVNDAQATAFGITTEKTTYDNAFQALANYLNAGTWTSGIPTWISDANLSTTTDIVGSTYRSTWKTYYDARTALLNAIAAKAKALADYAQSDATDALADAATAQSTATQKSQTFIQASAPAAGMVTGDYWLDSDDGYKPYVYLSAGWVVDSAMAYAIDAYGLADGKSTSWPTLVDARANGVIGDTFIDDSLLYYMTKNGPWATLENSIRATPKRYADVANAAALAALTGMINNDTVYQTDTKQWYFYSSGWAVDGPAITSTGVGADPAGTAAGLVPRYRGALSADPGSGNREGDYYYNTTSSKIRAYLSSAWADASGAFTAAGVGADPSGTAAGLVPRFRGSLTTDPVADNREGDYYYNTSSAKLRAYSSSAWADASGVILTQAQVDARVVAVAPRYLGSYPGDAFPASKNTDDWVVCSSTAGGHTKGLVYEWSGSAWVTTTSPDKLNRAMDALLALAATDTSGPAVTFVQLLIAMNATIAALQARVIQFEESVSAIYRQTPDTLTAGDKLISMGLDPRHPTDTTRVAEFVLSTYLGMNGTEEVWMKHFWTKAMANGMIGLLLAGGLQSCAPVYSSPGVMWVEQSDPFGATSIRGVAYGNGKWVAVANSGNIAYSTDGETWTLVTSSPFGATSIRGVAYGNGKWVAVGYGGKIAYSTDGDTWTLVTSSPFGTTIYGVAYGNGKWVAVGYDGKIAYSYDGETWTLVTSSPFGTTDIYGVAYGNGKWVAVGYSGKIAYSNDGDTWTLVTSSPFGTPDIRGVAYGNGKWVAVGYSGKIAYSNDGDTWTLVTSSPFGTTDIYGVAYGNGKWVAVGYYGKIAYSYDGETWDNDNVQQPYGSDGYYMGVAYSEDQNRFIAVGYLFSDTSGIIITSDFLEAGSGVVESGQDSDGNTFNIFSHGLMVQSGVADDATFSSSKFTSVAVIFPEEFAEPPKVFVNSDPYISGVAYVQNTNADSITTTGFKLSVLLDVNGSGSVGNLTWIAIGKKAV